jgi:hypothetical protein
MIIRWKKYNGEEEDDEIVMLIGHFTKYFRYDKFGGNQRNFRRKKLTRKNEAIWMPSYAINIRN